MTQSEIPDAARHVDAAAMDALIAKSVTEPRKRSHLLLHAGHHDQVQRLLIAAQPGSYVRPHVHSEQWEMLMLQRGALDLLFFAADGTVVQRHKVTSQGPVIQIPIGQWHGAVIAAPDTVILEVKPGPYRPNEFADWSPPEGDPRAAGFLGWVETAQSGQRWST